MSSSVNEPWRAASWLLAVAVHGVFFTFLYVGVSWRPKPQPPFTAELWSELPPVRQQPAKPRPEPTPPSPPPQPMVEPPREARAEAPPAPAAKIAPPEPSQADIVLK